MCVRLPISAICSNHSPSISNVNAAPFTILRSRVSSIHVLTYCKVTSVDKGGGRGQGAQPPNGRAKKKGRGYLYQMPNMYTCIAYLIEIRKFSSKNLVHKGVNFEAQNALKLTYEQL